MHQILELTLVFPPGLGIWNL